MNFILKKSLLNLLKIKAKYLSELREEYLNITANFKKENIDLLTKILNLIKTA